MVFGSGNADADLMFVGEAPGANEDRLGLPFVGQAGKLLDKLLGEIGLQRADVFICNTLKCRPPGNRDPQPNEIESCHSYLRSQVELIEPKLICTLGNFATKLLRERHDRDLAPARAGRRSRCSALARSGCIRCITRPLRSTRRRRWRRCGPTFTVSPSCSRSAPLAAARGAGARARARGGAANPSRRPLREVPELAAQLGLF